ncbi:MAG: TonB-dependent receptor [Opitutales bacterium]|nr:TonB-dependent receptor [Opitutales bacterium]
MIAIPSAWAGVLSGIVYDTDNDLYMESVRVSLPELGLNTTTGRGGGFRFTNVPEGTHTIVAAATGFPVSRMSVTVDGPNDEARVNFNLTRQEIFDLDTFVVEGTLIGAARAIDIRRAARDFREVVSSDAAGQFTDRNPAEALQRVAGVTTEDDQGEGSFIIVRGGAPEFSVVQIDGVSLATPEEDGRRVNLNVITVDQLERIELSKTWLPSQKGNVIGGTVNLITRSALDRGERFASVETAATYREHQSGEWSYRGTATYGDIFDGDTFSWLGDAAVGVQFSVNHSRDFSGSDTVTWSWNADKAYPFLVRPGEETPKGFTLQTVNKRNFNIERERTGASLRLEYRFNDRHEVFGSVSYNRFIDTENEHIFNMRQQNTSQFYSGTTFFSQSVAERLGADPDEPFNAQRLALSGANLARSITYNEAIQLGELAYDPELRLFTRGGLWAMPMDRDFSHTDRRDRITTWQIGGKSRLPQSIEAEWRLYGSEADQDAEQNWIRFSAGTTGRGAVPLAGPEVANPFLSDPTGDNSILFRKGSFNAAPTQTGGGTVRQRNLTESRDERRGGDLDLTHGLESADATWTTQAGLSVDSRDKRFAVDRNSYGIRAGGLDRERWPNDRMSLEDPLFDGGEITGFTRHFGEDMPFGPSFHESNTLAFLKDASSEGVTWFQTNNMLTNNVTSRVTNNYSASEDITGVYLQQTMERGAWTLVYGARYERTKNSFTNLDIITFNEEFPNIPFLAPTLWKALTENFGEIFATETRRDRSYDHWLPALHVIRSFGDNTIVRSSVTRTIARPLFSDLIPREVPSISGGSFEPEIRLPAFDLQPMKAVNFDVSVDRYFDPVGVFSVALFYKDLDGPIYDEIRRDVGPNEETAQWEARYNSRNVGREPGDPGFVNDRSYTVRRKRNAGSGRLYGAEITFDRRLDFLPAALRGFGVNSNIAWFGSRATLMTEGRAGESVNLFKQPDMTANLALYYERHGLFARLSYNMRGKYLDSVQSTSLRQLEDIGIPPNSRDIIVDRSERIDVTVRYRIRPSLQVFFNANNLTNEPLFRYEGDRSRPRSKQFTGRLFSLGLKWSL